MVVLGGGRFLMGQVPLYAALTPSCVQEEGVLEWFSLMLPIVAMVFYFARRVQGYLINTKEPPLQGPPYVPRFNPIVGS